MLMANAIDLAVPSVAGKEALAMEAFSRALRQLPTIIADNAGTICLSSSYSSYTVTQSYNHTLDLIRALSSSFVLKPISLILGLDSSGLVTQLRAAHANGQTNAGLNVIEGTVDDMWKLGIRESFKSKLQV